MARTDNRRRESYLMMRTTAGLLAITAALAASSCAARTSTTNLAPLPPFSASRGTGAAIALYPAPGRTEYRLGAPLPTLANQATAYRLAATTTPARVARLAGAFGISSAVTTDASGWTAGDSTLVLRVQRSGGLPWYLSGTNGGVSSGSGCAIAVPSYVAGDGSTAKSLPPTAPPPTCPPPTTVPGLPSQAEAERIARDRLAKAGFDVSGATPTASGGQGEWWVSFATAVGNVAVLGTSQSVTVGPHGSVVGAGGFLADPVSVGDYPLVGTTVGVQRLQQGDPWIIFGGPGPQPMMGAASGDGSTISAGSPGSGGYSTGSAGATGSGGAPTPPNPGGPATKPGATPAPTCGPNQTCAGPAPAPTCAPGATCALPTTVPAPCPADVACSSPGQPPAGPVPPPCGTASPCPTVPEPPPVVRTITGVHLGLAWAAPMDASLTDAWLVPVYIFELDSGGSIPVLAVQDRYLTTTTLPTAVGKP